eukprot:COSAG03_NODE_296_length_9245_cov_95.789744_5_plen_132_part_00
MTGPARRGEIMEVIEAHIDNLEGTDALEEIMSQSPLNMTDIHMARAEMKRLFHPRASAMKTEPPQLLVFRALNTAGMVAMRDVARVSVVIVAPVPLGLVACLEAQNPRLRVGAGASLSRIVVNNTAFLQYQ